MQAGASTKKTDSDLVKSQERICFIVGNSRSGTTMMMRIINNHSRLHALSELHFFEQLWSPDDKNKPIDRKAAIKLAERLLYVSREGYLTKIVAGRYRPQAEALVAEMKGDKILSQDVFTEVAFLETKREGKEIPCEKTPQNVFYIKEILELYPRARVLNMVRDPRGVLLSQKRKWMRRKMGAKFITWKEATRLRINYHPITISKLWNSSLTAARKFKDDDRVMDVRFEDILENGKREVQRICDFFEVDFEDKMLQIPHLGSSNEADDSGKLGIKSDRGNSWMTGGLNKTEIWFCQRITSKFRKQMGYENVQVSPNPFSIALYYVSFPVKIAMALMVNLNRMKDITETIKRRLAK